MGLHNQKDQAVVKALEMIANGATVIDVVVNLHVQVHQSWKLKKKSVVLCL